jgi:predicted ATPase
VLALDHCDHLADPCARLGQQLLASSPGLLLLDSRRAPRPIAGEVTWPVPPLALPPAGGDPAGGTGGDGIALFAERAAAAVPGFAVTAGNRAAVAEIGRLLDGLPLAIELAAARLRVLTVDQLAGSLRDRLELLAGDAAAAPPAHLTLRAALDWTHDQLAGPEQVLLRRLSVFAGWPQEMAERVCADDGLPAPGIGALLARLGDSALVGVEPDYLGQTATGCWMPSASTPPTGWPRPARPPPCTAAFAISPSPSATTTWPSGWLGSRRYGRPGSRCSSVTGPKPAISVRRWTGA